MGIVSTLCCDMYAVPRKPWIPSGVCRPRQAVLEQGPQAAPHDGTCGAEAGYPKPLPLPCTIRSLNVIPSCSLWCHVCRSTIAWHWSKALPTTAVLMNQAVQAQHAAVTVLHDHQLNSPLAVCPPLHKDIGQEALCIPQVQDGLLHAHLECCTQELHLMQCSLCTALFSIILQDPGLFTNDQSVDEQTAQWRGQLSGNLPTS